MTKTKTIFIAIIAMAMIASLCSVQSVSAAQTISAPAKISISVKSPQKTVSWSAINNADGYILCYANNYLFAGMRQITTSKNKATLKTHYSLYAKVRAYKKVDGKTIYSNWKIYRSSGVSKKAKYTKVKSNINKSGLNDPTQGSTTDGTYYYQAFGGTNPDNQIRIAKYRMSDYSRVKVSGKLYVGHGNSLAYIPETNQIAVTYSAGSYNSKISNSAKMKKKTIQKICFVDASTLKKEKEITASSYIKQYSGIAYFPGEKKFILRGKTDSTKGVVMNNSFKGIKRISFGVKSNQGTCAFNGDTKAFVAAQATIKKLDENYIMIFNQNGKLLQKLYIPLKGEIEGVFSSGNNLFFVFYAKHKSDTPTSIYKVL